MDGGMVAVRAGDVSVADHETGPDNLRWGGPCGCDDEADGDRKREQDPHQSECFYPKLDSARVGKAALRYRKGLGIPLAGGVVPG